MPSSILTSTIKELIMESWTDIRADRPTHEIDHLQNFYRQFYKYGNRLAKADSNRLEFRINNKYTFKAIKIRKYNEIISLI